MTKPLRRGKKSGKRESSGLLPIRKTNQPIKRNGKCPCGSGKKAKHCCLPQIKLVESLPPEQRRALLTDAIFAPKPVAQLTPVDHASAKAMLPSIDNAVEIMKGEANENT